MSALQNHQLGSFGSTFCCQKVEKTITGFP